MAKVLVDHEAVKLWAEARGGNPMMEDQPDGRGGSRSLLQITFGQHALNADENEGPDPIVGFELVSWDDWLAEFDRQGMALKVNDEQPGIEDNDFEFVARSGHGETTAAAQKPAL
jgi:hypothetical protein